MSSLPILIAAEVISKSNRDHPADAVLRDALASRRGPTAQDLREASRAVFSYYRWRGWIDSHVRLNAQIESALEIAGQFAAKPESFPDETLLAKASPSWVRSEVDVSPAWARALQTEPKLWLRSRRGQAAALAANLVAATLSELPDAVEYQGDEDLFRCAEFHAGDFEIQDIASQAVGWWCAPKPGETWWDACSGEGGKLLHLSGLMQNKGLIWASDRAEWRLKKLKRRAARAGVFNYRAAPWEGGAKLPTKTPFDGVLVDAPCSGLGTWQRNPHARWTTTLDDVLDLAAVQRRLLAHAAPSVKPGGKLLYAVCTLTRAETLEVAQWFGGSRLGFEPLALPEIPGIQRLQTPSAVRMIWPQDLGGNGMFVACWRRTR